MNDDKLIERLDRFGYFHAPGVCEPDRPFDELTRDSESVKQAIAVYQWVFEPDLSTLTRKYHGRAAVVDGDAGAATWDLIVNTPRCGHPDFFPSSAAVQEARFPDSCRESITTSYKMQLRGLSDSELMELWIRADQNWADAINVSFVLKKESYPNTNIYAFEAALSGSVLADQYLSQGGCGNRLRGRFDNRTWSRALFLATCTHEHGHALGYGHVTRDRNAIMYPSIHQNGMARGGTPNESDIRAMLSLGYKRRVGKPDKPDKPDPDGQTIHTFDVPRAGKVEVRYADGEPDNGWNI